jgi:hypothetical protein
LTTIITLSTLYDALDWSQADQSKAAWQRAHPGAPAFATNKNERSKLLAEALQGVVAFQLPPEIEETRQELFKTYDPEAVKKWARTLLNAAGVWTQVVAYLKMHNLIEVQP